MFIKNPNDEQLSAWMGFWLSWEEVDFDAGYVCYADIPEPVAVGEGIFWPDDWPDLSDEARMCDRAHAVMELHKQLRGDYEKRSRTNASNTNRRKSTRRKVVSKQYRASYNGRRWKVEVRPLRRK